MDSQDKIKPTPSSKAAKWWLALIGVVLFSITVAPDYQLQHVLAGVFIVVAFHLLTAFFERSHADNKKSVEGTSPSEPTTISPASTLFLLLPLALAGVIGVLAGTTSTWHAYFCAVAIGAFTAMCRLFPGRPTAKKDVVSGHF